MVIGFKNDKSIKDKLFIPAELPILPLRGTVAYPDLVMPLIVGREKSIRLIDDAMAKDRMIGIITQKNPDIEDPDIEDLYTIGTIATIMKMVKMVDGSQRIVVQGICRFKLVEFTDREYNLKAKILPIFEEYQRDIEVDAMYLNLKNLYKKAVEMAPYLSSELAQIASKVENPGNLSDLIASTINISVSEKQEILETIDLKERLKKVTILLNREVETLELSSRIQTHVKEGIDKTQREYYLREQLKAIQKELGETEDKFTEIEEIRKKGRISYKEFIEFALYHPHLGYYRKRSPGKDGDFYTSPTVSPIFGYTIGNFIKELDRAMGELKRLYVVEMGGGKGRLVEDIIDFLKKTAPSLLRRLQFYVVELENLVHVRKEGKEIIFVNDIDLLPDIEGLFFSNEFFDALPFRVVKKVKGKIKEVYLGYKDKFVEELGEPSDEVKEYMVKFPLKIENGQKAEIRCEDYKFMKQIARKLKKGAILTIDYGSAKPRFMTYRAYKNHRVYSEILDEPGLRDITSDVNFDVLRRAGEEEGAVEVFFLS